MDSINKLAFRDGAPDPMLGDETYEWEGGSTTIDPSRLLLSMDHTPLGVGELTGLSVDTDDRVRVSDDTNEAEDHTSAVDSASPLSFSLSDFSSSVSNENDFDAMDLDPSGPSATGLLPEHPPSSGLNRHIGWHDKKLNCPLPDCDKRYQYQKELEKHIWSHHPKWAEDTNRKPIRTKCRICQAILERPDNAKRHMDEVHKKIKRRRGPGG
ncbi:uncharacterized protein TRIVIDRAFT_58123 [Trichoderma virens Gv29-8]|uniref:BED-type domain-containing protein n=1 Tax=Hypocrea virens (strain Gv29-8 / FGSC 10586) TaxID=413071 RepID=G9MQF1_HYPVG|nr:uncharacterized protein TRIVIDRAFT_58123 [Trichoderma virens Gv29-8]EHK24072.1 hypothetical protein TRIVIDRAFT_58123 [Trichoderma virens Gv29-8]